jgi:MFS family permease
LVRIIHGIGEAFCFTASFTYIADIVPDDRLNEGIGMFGTTGLMGMAIGPTIAEIIIRDYGFTACFLTGSALGLAALLLQMPLKESFLPSDRTTTTSFMKVLRKGKIMTVAGVALVFGIGLAAYGGFVSPFAQELNLPMISLYFIAYSAAAIVTRLFGGRLADRVGEHRVVPYALIITGCGLLLLNWLGSSLLLVVSGLITGLGHGLLYPTLNALAIRHEPIHVRGKINGVYSGSIDAGILLGSVMLGFIGEAAGYRPIFLTAGLALFTGFLIFMAYSFITRPQPTT